MLSMLKRDWLSHFNLSSSKPSENLSVDFSLTSKRDLEVDEAFSALCSLEVGVVFLVSVVVSLSPSSEKRPLEVSLSWSLKASRLWMAAMSFRLCLLLSLVSYRTCSRLNLLVSDEY